MPSALDRYLARRRSWETALLVAWLLANAVFSAIVVGIEGMGTDAGTSWRDAWIWELTSHASVLLLIPLVLWLDHRFPLAHAGWRRSLLVHLLATLPFCLLHVLGMRALRGAVYHLLGDASYQPAPLGEVLGYEYLKDIRSYALLLGVFYLYRFVLLRLRGEVRLLSRPDTGPPVEPVERPARFLVRKLGAEFLIAASEIEWLEAAENYVNLHVRGRVYPLRSTMTAILERLDPANFVRVHRSYIVNLAFLERIEPLDTGDARLHMKGGAMVPCSRRNREALRLAA